MLPPLAPWIQLGGEVYRAVVVHTVTWIKHQTRGAPLSGPSAIKSHLSLPPEVFSHLAASLMDGDRLIMWLHFFSTEESLKLKLTNGKLLEPLQRKAV